MTAASRETPGPRFGDRRSSSFVLIGSQAHGRRWRTPTTTTTLGSQEEENENDVAPRREGILRVQRVGEKARGKERRVGTASVKEQNQWGGTSQKEECEGGRWWRNGVVEQTGEDGRVCGAFGTEPTRPGDG